MIERDITFVHCGIKYTGKVIKKVSGYFLVRIVNPKEFGFTGRQILECISNDVKIELADERDKRVLEFWKKNLDNHFWLVKKEQVIQMNDFLQLE